VDVTDPLHGEFQLITLPKEVERIGGKNITHKTQLVVTAENNKGQTTIYKTLHKKLKIEQHESH
jgi:hypothetical protein